MLCYTEKNLSLPFFSQWSISSLQWDGKGATTGAGKRRGQHGVLHHQTQRSSCQGWLPECYSDGIKVWCWFPSCMDIYLNWHLKPLTLPTSSYFSLLSSADMKKLFVWKRWGQREKRKDQEGPGVYFQSWSKDEISWNFSASQASGIASASVHSGCTEKAQGWQKSFVPDQGWEIPVWEVSLPFSHMLLWGAQAERAGHGALPSWPCCLWDSLLSSLLLALIAFIMDIWPIYFCFIK